MATERICLDSSVWNAILNQETDKDLESILSVLKRADDGRALLLVPAIVVAEIHCSPDSDAISTFEKTLNRSFVLQIDITYAIAKKAGELRRKIRNDQMQLKTPDSLVVACAEQHNCTKLLSYDVNMLRCCGRYDLKLHISKPEDFDDLPLFNQRSIPNASTT